IRRRVGANALVVLEFALLVVLWAWPDRGASAAEPGILTPNGLVSAPKLGEGWSCAPLVWFKRATITCQREGGEIDGRERSEVEALEATVDEAAEGMTPEAWVHRLAEELSHKGSTPMTAGEIANVVVRGRRWSTVTLTGTQGPMRLAMRARFL